MPESSVHSTIYQYIYIFYFTSNITMTDRKATHFLTKCLKQYENDQCTLHTLNVKCLHLYVHKAESEAIKKNV